MALVFTGSLGEKSICVTPMIGPACFLLTSVQLIQLLCMVNVTNMPPVLASYSNSLVVPTFSYLPNLAMYVLPESVRTASGMRLPAPFQNYPPFVSKSFIANMGSLATFYSAIVVCALVCLLGRRTAIFQRLLERLPNLLLRCTALHFIQSTFAAFVQTRYVRFPESNTAR